MTPAITADSVVARIVAGYTSLVSPLANSLIGAITADLPNTRYATHQSIVSALASPAQATPTSTRENAATGGWNFFKEHHPAAGPWPAGSRGIQHGLPGDVLR
ncbi:hypothetical protein [Polaromonas sp.]|jgi:hypothetical protein|uniref:hypothetical protein n=1 Tax=Polaromonas sp. TaxID=1869339 RepID=UPI001DE2C486|nr:hypothetical protein [Polaromonas sp.]MBT9474933.1 hypothetical protein [Polaromonas sp.]